MKRVLFTIVGLLLGVALTIGGLYIWAALAGELEGSLFDNSLDTYNMFEAILIFLSIAGALLGWWYAGITTRRPPSD